MDNTALTTVTTQELRRLFLNGENPFGELTQKRRQELRTLGITDPFGYLSDDEWYKRALQAVDFEIVDPIIVGLDDIDWTTIYHGFGSAESIPIQFRAMLSNDYLGANVAWQNLTSNLLHQNSVYYATVLLMPYWLRMLRSDEPRFAYMSLSFLSGLAWACSPDTDEPQANENTPELVSRHTTSYSQQIWTYLLDTLSDVSRLSNHDIPDIQDLSQKLYLQITNPGLDV